MKLNKLNFLIRIALTLGALGFSSNALAYLDPGTGSIILQALLAAIVGSVITLKLYWLRVKSFIASLFSSNNGGGDDSKNDEKDEVTPGN